MVLQCKMDRNFVLSLFLLALAVSLAGVSPVNHDVATGKRSRAQFDEDDEVASLIDHFQMTAIMLNTINT